jgi:hypothetical protein
MPASMKSLTKAQRQTLAFLVGTIALLGAAAWLLYNLNSQRVEVAAAKQELERKENAVRGFELPAVEERTQWLEQKQRFEDTLLSDQDLPAFYSDITRIAGETQLDQRFGLNPEEKTISAEQNPTPEQARILAVGIKRYVLLTLNFRGDYPNVSRFLDALSRLPHAIEYQTIDMRREGPLVEVTLVMQVYKRESA